jgi:hypothetical protein
MQLQRIVEPPALESRKLAGHAKKLPKRVHRRGTLSSWQFVESVSSIPDLPRGQIFAQIWVLRAKRLLLCCSQPDLRNKTAARGLELQN